MFALGPIDPNLWLSWNWNDPMWDIPDSTPFAFNRHMAGDQATLDENYLGVAGTTPLNGIDNSLTSAAISHGQDTASGDPFLHIMNARLDPLESHRQIIVRHLNKQPGSVQQAHRPWLDRDQFPLLIKTYFVRHHRHTPIVHLPTFNVVDSPTFLVFAMALIAASYVPTAGLRTADILQLVKIASMLIEETDRGLSISGAVSLEALQALLLLSILDRLMIRRRSQPAVYAIDLGRVCQLARFANIFQEPTDVDSCSWASWASWAEYEARRR